MPSVYRTALGKQVDIDRIRLQNENAVAVGNMRVNAKGDELGSDGQVKQSKDERMVNSRPNKTYNMVVDDPIPESRSIPAPSRTISQSKDNTAELQATIDQLQKQLAETNAQLAQVAAGKTLREAVADEPVKQIEEVDEILNPTNTDNKPARGGLAAAIQKNMELQAKKTKPKRI